MGLVYFETMLLSTPPFSPSVIKTLNHLQIFKIDDLKKHHAATLFLQLKAEGLTITLSVLWQLQAAINNQSVHEISQETKQELQNALKTHAPVAARLPNSEMNHYMSLALKQAEKAAFCNEIPVGAVIVHQQKIIAEAHNTCIMEHSACKHAEINALNIAGEKLQNYRLNDCDVYITLEPCPMCASALIQSRVKRVIFAAKEPKMGAAGSILNLFEKPMNQHTALISGILEQESQQLLQQFFQSKRSLKNT